MVCGIALLLPSKVYTIFMHWLSFDLKCESGKYTVYTADRIHTTQQVNEIDFQLHAQMY